MKNAIILCSGGLDSITTAYYVKKSQKYNKIIILFFDYGQKTKNRERGCAKKCAKNMGADFIEIKLGWLGKISSSLINKPGKVKRITKKGLRDTKKESEKFYVPCRNAVFLVHALALAESLNFKEKKDYDIFVGFKCEGKESYPDTTIRFVNEMNKLGRISCRGIKIKAPLIKKDKEDIIRLGKRLGMNFKETYSCYIGKEKHCGYCLACKLRQAGFYWANVKDPTNYGMKMKDFKIA